MDEIFELEGVLFVGKEVGATDPVIGKCVVATGIEDAG